MCVEFLQKLSTSLIQATHANSVWFLSLIDSHIHFFSFLPKKVYVGFSDDKLDNLVEQLDFYTQVKGRNGHKNLQ